MPKIYTTIQGDTWDIIAKRVYNDEMGADALMTANIKLLKTSVFPAGVIINVPEYAKEKSSRLPPWKRN